MSDLLSRDLGMTQDILIARYGIHRKSKFQTNMGSGNSKMTGLELEEVKCTIILKDKQKEMRWNYMDVVVKQTFEEQITLSINDSKEQFHKNQLC